MKLSGTFDITADGTSTIEYGAKIKYGIDDMLHYDCVVRIAIERFLKKLGYTDIKVDIEIP